MEDKTRHLACCFSCFLLQPASNGGGGGGTTEYKKHTPTPPPTPPNTWNKNLPKKNLCAKLSQGSSAKGHD